MANNDKCLRKWVTLACLFYIFCRIGVMLPNGIRNYFPYSWGWLEGKAGKDLTGFYFTPLVGYGNCRIINSVEAFKTPGSKIIFGAIKLKQGKEFLHLWAENTDHKVIDLACHPDNEFCKNRRMFAKINPGTLQLENNIANSVQEQFQVEWGLRYLEGLKHSVN